MAAPERELDLLDGDFYAGDPDPTYRWLRTHAPVYRDRTNQLWGISRYDDIVHVERHPELFCSGRGFRPNFPGDASMIGQDDPRHLLQRRLFNSSLTPRKVLDLEPLVRETVTGLLDAFADRGECDVVRDVAIPLPVMLVIRLIGFDVEAWPVFAEIAETTNAAGGGPRYLNESVMKAVLLWRERIHALIGSRRDERRTDATSAMLDAHEARRVERSDDDMAMEALLLLNGGSDTTRHVIGGATLALLEHPEQLELLRREPERIPVAVEEFIRWVTPILNMRRTATRDTEIAGIPIAEGEEVLMMFSSANRDETRFTDPDRFDVTRDPNPHLSFGLGTHFCLGASLARLELRVVFEEMLRRLEDLRRATEGPLPYVRNAFVRGLEALPVRFR
ncbi:MAG: cytochrome P450 [Deltaproteobacteria bacterium]|nr:cytochrome P450 [Deltaproteobacteria bacterium]